jgi:hypothetical protein
MTQDPETCLSERHLALFGAILRGFARDEQIMLRLTAATSARP